MGADQSQRISVPALTSRRDIISSTMTFDSSFRLVAIAFAVLALHGSTGSRCGAAEVDDQPRADLILHHCKIVTVDKDFSIHQAMAIQGGRILRGGSEEEVLQTKGAENTPHGP